MQIVSDMTEYKICVYEGPGRYDSFTMRRFFCSCNYVSPAYSNTGNCIADAQVHLAKHNPSIGMEDPQKYFDDPCSQVCTISNTGVSS